MEETKEEVKDENQLELDFKLEENEINALLEKSYENFKTLIYQAIDTYGLKGVIITDKEPSKLKIDIEQEVYNKEEHCSLKGLVKQGVIVLYNNNESGIIKAYNKSFLKEFAKHQNIPYIFDFKSLIAADIDSLNNTIINESEGCYKQFNAVYKDINKTDIIW